MPAVTPKDAETVYRPNLTAVQWSILSDLAAGWVLVAGNGGRMDLQPDGSAATAGAAIRYGRHNKASVQALAKRGYVAWVGMGFAAGITDLGRAALAFKPQEVTR